MRLHIERHGVHCQSWCERRNLRITGVKRNPARRALIKHQRQVPGPCLGRRGAFRRSPILLRAICVRSSDAGLLKRRIFSKPAAGAEAFEVILKPVKLQTKGSNEIGNSGSEYEPGIVESQFGLRKWNKLPVQKRRGLASNRAFVLVRRVRRRVHEV